MIYLYTDKEKFTNEISEEIRMFLECDKIETVSKEFADFDKKDKFFINEILQVSKGKFQSKVYLKGFEKNAYCYDFQIDETDSEIISKRKIKFAIKLSFYFFLKRYTKKIMPWGSLTGIRPTKMLRDLINRLGKDEALRYMSEDLDISHEKLSLASDIVTRQEKTIATIGDKSADIYIHIPFCPSICHYCSFASTPANNVQLQSEYIECLKNEIMGLADIVKNYDIRTIYVGGGTPTSLSLDNLEKVLDIIKNNFKKPIEYTVEAGRPDTLSLECLSLLKKYGVDRISVNPQTLKQKTLDQVGRKHTVEQFVEAFNLARQVGFDNINIDLIFGLPNESLFDMKRTLKKIIKINPESITIHTLSIKNSAKFGKEVKYKSNESIVEKAVRWSNKACVKNGFSPYYMYRQKYMKGNLENVGYAKENFDSIYNIDMMEEVCNVIAFGAGAISKRIYSEQNRLQRSPNVKDLKTYIQRYESMVERKMGLFTD